MGVAAKLSETGVAVIGFAGRFPNAPSVAALWHMVRSGGSGIRFVSDAELAASGSEPAVLPADYVRYQGVLDNPRCFDAALFGYSPREAALLDPQQRILLETAWTALEHAGYGARTGRVPTGVFVSGGWNAYLLRNLAPHRELMGPEFEQQTLLANEKDSLATRIAYKLDLTGPSLSVQTACSSSLVATCLAHQSLLDFQCDIALAGGVSLAEPQLGYRAQHGSILSPDGRCRAFDKDANGTVPGSGAAIVVLKRLADAIADRDTIHAVITGSAFRNDGAARAAFTAPSAEGQAAAIAAAWAMAGVPPESVGYIEAHGTGTLVGDPVEIAGLARVFGERLRRAGRICPIGSLKSNIGHLDAAAGVAGLIKTAMMLSNAEIPPSLNFCEPNPHIDFDHAGFAVNRALIHWHSDGPRRAGVSAFGLGGTNAHVVLQEAPSTPARTDDGPAFLAISANTASALDQACHALAEHLEADTPQRGVDIGYTLLAGRQGMPHRRAIVWDGSRKSAGALRSQKSPACLVRTGRAPQVAFLFSGQEGVLSGIAGSLYRDIPAFREALEPCLAHLRKTHRLDLAPLMLSDVVDSAIEAELGRTKIVQPALLALEYALATTWQSWGIRPVAYMGHSLGEYAAACVSGALDVKSCLDLIVRRGALMESLPTGAMLSIGLGEQAVGEYLDSAVNIAAVNAPKRTVVSGTIPAIEALERRLATDQIAFQRLPVDRGFHSHMVVPMLEPFSATFTSLRVRDEKAAFVSCLDGGWISGAEAVDSARWLRHAREPVRFHDGLTQLIGRLRVGDAPVVLLEVGPGRSLSRLAGPVLNEGETALATLDGKADCASQMMRAAARLWSAGVQFDGDAIWWQARPRRIALPTYPFERDEHWIAAPQPANGAGSPFLAAVSAGRRAASAPDALAGQQGRDAALENLALSHMGRAVAALLSQGREGRLPQDLTRSDLAEKWINALERHRGLTLADNGSPDPASLHVDTDETIETLAHAAVAAENDRTHVDLMMRCGPVLAEAITGRWSPVELFSTVLESADLHPGNRQQQGLQSVLEAAVRAVLAARPQGASIRLLEVGGGTGIAASVLMPLLPSERATYVFTDVAAGFVNQARERFSDYPACECRRLDLDRPFEEQAPLGAPFDIVIAVNVLHATRDIDQSLDRIRSVLAPGALLFLWEITKHRLDFDVTYALLMNAAGDKRRSRSEPFLSAEQWPVVLREHGFANVEDLAGGMSGETIFVACYNGAEAVPAQTCQDIALTKKSDVSEWFYVPMWRPGAALPRQDPRAGRWMLFGDGAGIASAVARYLCSSGAYVIEVRPGSAYARAGDHFVVDPRNPHDYSRLFAEIADADLPDQIIHMWDTDNGPERQNFSTLWASVDLGPVSLIHLVQAIGQGKLADHETSLTIVTVGARAVAEETVLPQRALAHGAARVIPLELATLSCKTIDVGVPSETEGLELIAGRLVDEVLAGHAPHVCHRGRRRWLPEFGKLALKAPAFTTLPLRAGGTYLITGGLGTIGLIIAEWLARKVKARLVLLSRRSLPPRDQWGRPLPDTAEGRSLSCLIGRICAVESQGGFVIPYSADVSDPVRMRQVVEEVARSHGPIHGVIHAAGILGDGSIQNKTRAELLDVLKPKVGGCMALADAFDGRSLDFLLLFSSMSAVNPGFGQVAYASANAYLDAWAQSASARKFGCVSSISWDVWQGQGMAYSATASDVIERIKRTDFSSRGILPHEGIEALERILAAKLDHVLVATSDYLTVLSGRNASMSTIYLELAEKNGTSSLEFREGAEKAVLNDEEAAVGAIWKVLLGVEDLTSDTDFFDLGGDSLIATQLLNRIHTRFGVRLSMRTLHRNSTLSGLTQAVAAAREVSA